jgi:uncharacterized damage-inducible protein DinB
MADIPETFISEARSHLEEYLKRLERCMAMLSEEDVWWRPNEASNSVGNLLLHLAGSTRAWLVSGVGNTPQPRDREHEFAARGDASGAELLAQLKEAVTDCDVVLERLDSSELLQRRQVGKDDVTVLYAIFHAVEHFSMHTGQIIVLTKMRTGKALE